MSKRLLSQLRWFIGVLKVYVLTKNDYIILSRYLPESYEEQASRVHGHVTHR